MITPLISVVLPVYNCEKYIAEAVESILQQSFRDFEFIIIDDGSTDKTQRILRKYESEDLRIRLISRQNRGLVASLNEGIDLAHGEWIARMDADDISLPHRFERQLQWLKTTGADITGSWYQYFGGRDKRIIKMPETDSANKIHLLFDVPFGHPTVMMRTTLVKQLGGYKAVGKQKSVDLCEDYDLWERAALAGWKMTNVQEVLLMYRQHTGQISTVTAMQVQFFTKVVQRRYWEFVCNDMRMNKDWIDEVMKIREPSSPKINMDYVDSAFVSLLQGNHGEAKDTILVHITRLYYRMAADCPDIVSRFSALNKKFGIDFALEIKLKLWLLRMFRLRFNSGAYYCLKKFRFRL